MVKTNSNELGHCPSAVLHPKSGKLGGAMLLPAAGGIPDKHWEKHKRVNEMLGSKLQKPVANPLCAQVRDGGEGVSGVIIPNPKGSYASSKDSRGRHGRAYACGVLFQHCASATAAQGGAHSPASSGRGLMPEAPAARTPGLARGV